MTLYKPVKLLRVEIELHWVEAAQPSWDGSLTPLFGLVDTDVDSTAGFFEDDDAGLSP